MPPVDIEETLKREDSDKDITYFGIITVGQTPLNYSVQNFHGLLNISVTGGSCFIGTLRTAFESLENHYRQ